MKVSVLGVVAALFVSTMTPASAQDGADPYGDLAAALFQHMANTYMCRNALGGIAHYQAARSIAIGSMAPHVGRDQAVLYVDEMDRKFKADPRARNPDLDDAACLEAVNDGLYRIDVVKARLPKQ